MRAPVRGVVDTQVVAAFLGYGLQVGLTMLLERVLKVRIKKDQTYTDWTRRPLKPEQLVYAREDVVHLLPLYDRLRADLEKRGRTAWAEEELRALEAARRRASRRRARGHRARGDRERPRHRRARRLRGGRERARRRRGRARLAARAGRRDAARDRPRRAGDPLRHRPARGGGGRGAARALRL